MAVELVVILVLAGYALGATMALFAMMGRSQTQPATVVVQQAPDENNNPGCGALIIYPLIVLIFIVLANVIVG